MSEGAAISVFALRCLFEVFALDSFIVALVDDSAVPASRVLRGASFIGRFLISLIGDRLEDKGANAYIINASEVLLSVCERAFLAESAGPVLLEVSANLSLVFLVVQLATKLLVVRLTVPAILLVRLIGGLHPHCAGVHRRHVRLIHGHGLVVVHHLHVRVYPAHHHWLLIVRHEGVGVHVGTWGHLLLIGISVGSLGLGVLMLLLLLLL
jgi:hypothetical protein